MNTSPGSPLISVIVCTRNRQAMLWRALDSIHAQDINDFEVIVVDDGSDPPVALPGYYRDQVRLIRTEHRGVGAARSEGLNAATGTFVAYCDDDDQWKPAHLSTLLTYLREHPDVDLAYADSEWLQDGVPPSVAYSIDYEFSQLSWGNYIFASDVMHRAGAARAAGGFDPALRAYEDWDLWMRMSRTCVLRHVPVVLGCHHWHDGCVSATEPWQEWERVYQNQQDRLARAGAAGRHALIAGAAPAGPFDPDTWRPGRRELIWQSVLGANHSFAYVARQLILALERQGVDITVAPTRNQPVPSFKRFYKPLDHWGRFAFYYDWKQQPSALESKRVIVYAMWESTLVPAEHVEELNKAATLLYVPCRQNVQVFRDCGVRVPMRVLHHGVDGDQFPYLSRCCREFFTFGTFGDLSPRKGIDVLIRAFVDEFAASEPVRLLMKSTFPLKGCELTDPRITFLTGFTSHEELLEVLRRMDAFVLPSRGEGFGLCGLEAMSTGLPVIGTNWSGPAEYLDPEYSFPLSYRLVDARGSEGRGTFYFGQWAEPNYEHLRYLMRWVYEHREEAAEKGQTASDRVRESWTWDRPARQMCDDLDVVASR